MKIFVTISIFFASFFFAGMVQAEEVVDFAVDYTIESDATVSVTESITYDFGEEQRHGIFRTIYDKHPQPATVWYKNRFVELDVVSVERDSQPEPYDVSKFGNEYEIKIGDPDAIISGIHTYKITYTLNGAISYGEQGSEFYWNVSGHDWEVPIQAVEARVFGEAIAGNNACYKGVEGDTETCTIEAGDNFTTFLTNTLDPGEGLTIAVELDSDQIPVLIHEKTTGIISYALQALFAVALLWYLIVWYRRDKIDKPIIAQYEPYKKYLPMYTGVLFDKTLDSHDITAGILYLAEQGFISITKTEKKVLLTFTTTDYDITLLHPVSKIPTDFLKTLLTLLFDYDSAVGTTVSISSLAKNSTENYKTIMNLQSAVNADIKASGFIKKDHFFSDKKHYLVGLPVAILVSFWSWILLLVSVVLVLCFGFASRRSTLGYEALNHIQGFKLFLSVTEKERYKFHNAPEKSPELFMEYLPYAIALKVEKQWAKVFEGITIPNPSWYHSSTGGVFSATALASDIGSFSSTFATSSGISGSSGSGSSGGGGGGGGGGSW